MDEAKEKEKEELTNATKLTPKKKFSCLKCMFWSFAIVVAVVSVIVGYLYLHFRESEFPQEIIDNIGPDGVQLFMAYDRDGDGYISMYEYETLYEQLAGDRNVSVIADKIYDQPIEDDDNVVTMVTSFQPLLLDSMTREKDRQDSWTYNFVEETREMMGGDSLVGLRGWKTPNHEQMTFAVRHFKPFLPPTPTYHNFNQVYKMLEDQSGAINNMFNADLSSNRYFPPFVADKSVIIHRLLAMFHPRPFIYSRFRPRGSIAIVRARNDEYMEIVFRIHAEFQLNEPPFHPFWFTPAQFTGSLIISTDYKHILQFNMHVPASRKLNVDMEWLEGAKSMVVDIGYMPEMTLNSTGPSLPVNHLDNDQQTSKMSSEVKDIKWHKEITHDEALQKLEQDFYPFKQVPYYNFTESLRQGQLENKLVHSVLLWGALDDQSC